MWVTVVVEVSMQDSLNGYKYVVTPGGCTDSSTPTCAGGSDTVVKAWATQLALPSACCTPVLGCEFCNNITNIVSVTDGFSNTTTLATNYSDTNAAKYCANMDYGGYSDWFLPAQDELNLLYLSKAILGGFLASAYLTSTELSDMSARIQMFDFGTQSSTQKTQTERVRCVRRY